MSLGGLGVLLGFTGPLHAKLPLSLGWALDLAIHWQWLYVFLLCLGVALIAASGKSLRWLVAALFAPLPLWSASNLASSADTGPVLTVASANVFVHNEDAGRLLTWLQAEGADVAVVLEVSPKMAKALEADGRYPFKKLVPDTDAFGIAVLSRLPLTNVKVRTLRAGPSYLTMQVQWGERPLSLVALHTMPPILGPEGFAERDADIAAVLAEARGTQLPAIVAGDLNASAWTGALSAAEAAGFRRTTSLTPTWHAAFRGVTGIPIDHILVTQGLAVKESRRGPNLGSDHFPVVSRLTLTAQ